MDQSTKTCVMCRKDIDFDAKICPFCNSDTNYSALVSTKASYLFKNVNKTKEVTQLVLMLLIIIACFGFGFLLFSIWGGLGGAVIGYKLFNFIFEVSPSSTYTYHLTCPICSSEDDVVWSSTSFDENNRGFVVCGNCSKKIMVESL